MRSAGGWVSGLQPRRESHTSIWCLDGEEHEPSQAALLTFQVFQGGKCYSLPSACFRPPPSLPLPPSLFLKKMNPLHGFAGEPIRTVMTIADILSTCSALGTVWTAARLQPSSSSIKNDIIQISKLHWRVSPEKQVPSWAGVGLGR